MRTVSLTRVPNRLHKRDSKASPVRTATRSRKTGSRISLTANSKASRAVNSNKGNKAVSNLDSSKANRAVNKAVSSLVSSKDSNQDRVKAGRAKMVRNLTSKTGRANHRIAVNRMDRAAVRAQV